MTRLAAIAFALALALGAFTPTASSAKPAKPSNTVPPAVSGTALTAQTLSTSSGTWSGSSPMSYKYQWQRCDALGSACANVSNATRTSYVVSSADEGRTLRSAVTASNSRGSATAYSAVSPVVTLPADVTAPAAPTGLAVSNVLDTSLTLSWVAATDNIGVAGYRTYRNGALVGNTTALAQAHIGLACATSYTLAVEAYDAAGNTSTRASVNGTTAACPLTNGEYFGTLAVGTTVPRGDADCAARVTRNVWEPRPGNTTANQSVPTTAVPWNNTSAWTYWQAFISKRNKVTGNFKGTTDEIIQWGACKWGIDEDLLRAVAVQESYWNQTHQGDLENGRYHSFGLMQIRHDDAAGTLVKGGYPATLQHTALNVDYFGAEIRACFEGDFYDGGAWLYGGTQIKGDLWGCVGYWYSGNWYTTAAKEYIASVQNHLATKPWVAWGYPGKLRAADTTAPTAPTSLTSSNAMQTSVTLSWAASTDNVAVTGYRVYNGRTAVATTTSLSATVSGLSCATSYTFSVEALDAAGNVSPLASVTGTTAACSSTDPGLRVQGNKLVDGGGKVVTLRGVNRSGPEYACVQGWGIFEGPTDAASVLALKSWNANVVHIGLNEHCILGINGVKPEYSGATYMNAIVAYVNLLHQHGIYALVSLMWAAPGTQPATGHPYILNQDHSPAALRAIANAFKNDPMTIIGLQSEPHNISWACWANGGSSCSVGYAALGMQGALDAVRSTGATNVVTASGIDYANNLSQWLTYRPKDSLGQLMAEAHVYGKNVCSAAACFDQNYKPVVDSVPLIYGEFGETYDASSCDSANTKVMLDWADAHGVSYAAWTWNIWGNCLDLIGNYDGTAKASGYATFVRDRLRSHGA